MNLTNSVLTESPKFKNIGIPTFDATGINNINFALSTISNSLNRMWRENFRGARLGYTLDFEIVSKKIACSNHIKNSELKTGEVFEQETENILHTQQTDLVTTLHENPLPRSKESSKKEERQKLEVNPDPEPSFSDSPSETSSSDSRSTKKKRNKMKKRHKHQKDDLSDPSSSDDSDYYDDSDYRRKRRKNKKHRKRI